MAIATSGRQLSVISSIKCSTCGKAIPLNTLSTHLCEAAMPPPPLPLSRRQDASRFDSNFQRSPERNLPTTSALGYQRWGKPDPPPKIDSAFANESYGHKAQFSASDRSDFSLRSGSPATPSTNITSPGSYFSAASGKLSRTPSPPTESERSNSTSPPRLQPEGLGRFDNAAAMSKQARRPGFLDRADMTFNGPFGLKSPGPPPGRPSNQSQNGPAQMRMAPRTPSPQEDMLRNGSSQKTSAERRGPRLTAVNNFLEEMDQPPKFLKPEDRYNFSTSTPHLSSGPGPAFTEEGPVSPFDFEFKPEPPPKNEPRSSPKSEPRQPAHTHKRSGSNPRFNQFPPPKNMKRLNASPPAQRRPSTPGNNSVPVVNKSPPSNLNRTLPPQLSSNPHSKADTKRFGGQDPAVQMGLDPSLRRSNSNPLEETNTSDSQNEVDHSKSATSHRSFPDGSGPPKHICRGCTRSITGPSLKDSSGRLTGRYHKSCFTCTTCAAPFPTGDFYVLKNEPFCAQHYHERNGSMCIGCRAGIEGPYAETDDKKLFHSKCFRCADCNVAIEGPEYWEMNGKVVCGKHINAATIGTRGTERRRTRFGMMGMGQGMGQGGAVSRDRLAPPDPRHRWM